MKYHPYQLYEASVQTPNEHIAWLLEIFETLTGRKPISLREDFCGTFLMATEWVKTHSAHTALALDLSSEALDYGTQVHYHSLKPEQRKRLRVFRQNVMTTTDPVDLVVAENFSFNAIKDPIDLRRYFKNVWLSLNPNSLFILEVGGGPGMSEESRETRQIKKRDKHWFTYIWEQKNFNPINHEGDYSISFRFPAKLGIANPLPQLSRYKDAFRYDWRLWTIPEIKSILEDAGFKKILIYWEASDHAGKLTGHYHLTDKGEHDHAWISYVVGVR